MIIRKEIDFDKPLTEAQKNMMKEMEHKPAAPDEDCPEYTEEELLHMMKLAAERRADRHYYGDRKRDGGPDQGRRI